MLKPAEFLEKYQTVLFDMDGVITSEQRYWDCSALTVYEYLNPDVVPSEAMADAGGIRKRLFHNDETLIYLKSSGVNSNWDTTYIVLSAALMLGTDDFAAVYDYITGLRMNAFEMYDYFGERSPAGVRGGEVYHNCVLSFQEWYLGDALFEEKWHTKTKRPGKEGLIRHETPILPLDALVRVLKTLYESGVSLGIGTGRVNFELELPLDGWDN